jgi:hypothetical protein
MLRRGAGGLIVMLWAAPMFSQDAGRIVGKLTDPNGDPVPTASLQFKNIATATVYQTSSVADGSYALAGVPAGTYSLTIPTIGFTFRRFERAGIAVAAGQVQRVDIAMPWGGNLGTPGDDISMIVRTRSPAPSGPVPRTADGKPDFSGVWMGLPGSGEQPTLLPWADVLFKERAADGGRDHPSSFCLPGDPILKDPFLYKLIQSPGLMVILWEGNLPGVHQVFLDGRGHPAVIDPSWMGHSVGRWEGDTLVVDTVGFHDRSWVGIFPHTEALHVVQRYRRTDLGHMEKDILIEDPGAFAKPWNWHVAWELAPGEEIQEMVCESNNYGAHLAPK